MAAFGSPPADGGRTYPGVSATRFSPAGAMKVWEDTIRKERAGRATHQLLETYGKLGLHDPSPSDPPRMCDMMPNFSSIDSTYKKLGWSVHKNGRMVQPDAYAIVRQSTEPKLLASANGAGAKHEDASSNLSRVAPAESSLSRSAPRLSTVSACPPESKEARRSCSRPEAAATPSRPRKGSKGKDAKPSCTTSPGPGGLRGDCRHDRRKHQKAPRKERTASASAVRSPSYQSCFRSSSAPGVHPGRSLR